MARKGAAGAAGPVLPDEGALLAAAREVLDNNWRGHSTVPAPRLYPHQWSWDSALIAIGLSWVDQGRAQTELESLLSAQWEDGRIPHIVFSPSVPADAYFPGPDFWRSSDVAAAAAGTATSGLIQPPLHAMAALEVYRNGEDRSEGLAFLRRVLPALDRWHRYLLDRRDPGGIGLAAILHPWESGLDNSPAWEEALAAFEIPNGVLPAYRRRDLEGANPADRPSDAAYDRFVYLAETYRGLGYDDRRICAMSPFVIVGPLVNALLVTSSLALAEIAGLLGEDPSPHRSTADAVRRAMQAQLWDPEHGRYYSRNLRTDALLREASILSFMPLIDPGLPSAGVEAIVRDLRAASFHPPEAEEHYLVPSYSLTGLHFDARRYWRGPVWINTDWLIWRGLRQHGHEELAVHVADSMLGLVSRSGFHECFDPFTGAGYGSDSFSWTAALTIDLIQRRRSGRT
jgi:glycogen debranching enzyme